MEYRQKNGISVIWLLVVFLVILTVYLILSNHINARKELLIQQGESSRTLLSRLEAERADLLKNIEQTTVDAFIEDLARSQYGFLRSVDTRFEITNPEALFTDNEIPILSVISE